MIAKKRSTPAIWSDLDDAAQLTAEFFESADLYKGTKIQTRGRPKAAITKEPVKLRLDAACWQHFVQAAMDGKHASMKHCVHHCVWLVGSDI